MYRQRKHPLHLTFRAREGVKVVDEREEGGVSTEETPPPSHVSSEGGDGGVLVEGTPPPPYVSSEGGWLVGGKETPPSRISSKGGDGCWWQGNPLRLKI